MEKSSKKREKLWRKTRKTKSRREEWRSWSIKKRSVEDSEDRGEKKSSEKRSMSMVENGEQTKGGATDKINVIRG